MHNWRLLLLAFVAVFQPIASFTERNLVDGRQRSCDYQLHSTHRDTRLTLDGPHRFGKTVSENHRLNQRNDIREGRLHEPRVYDSNLNRLSTDRQREIRERRVSSEVRLNRRDYHLERVISEDQRRERVSLDSRARNVGRTRINERIDNYRRSRSQSRLSRDFIPENRRKAPESSRNRLSRDDSRRSYVRDEKSKISIDSQRQTTRRGSRSEEVRRTLLSRDYRSTVKRERTNVVQDISDNRSRRVLREAMDVHREATLRVESRIQSDDNRERRSVDRRSREIPENRRSLSAVSRIDGQRRNVLGERRLNSREQSQEERRGFNKLRYVTERFDENRDQREASRDRTRLNRQEYRDSNRILLAGRQLRESARRSRTMEVQRENANERDARMQNRNERRTILETRRTESRRMERENTDNRGSVTTDRRSRSIDRLDSRVNRNEARHPTFGDSLIRDVSRVRGEYRIGTKNAERDTIDARIRNSESARYRINLNYLNQKQVPENQVFMNWQIVFYTLQGIYLCGLLMQMIKENGSGKPKSKGLHWWSAPSTTLIKVD